MREGIPIHRLDYSQNPTRRLLQAVQRNDLATARAAVAAGADPHQRYKRYKLTDKKTDRTVLMAAVYSGDDAMIGFLLDLGLDPNTPTADGSTATSMAWFDRRERFAQLHARGGQLGLASDEMGHGVLYQALELLANQQEYDSEGFMAPGGPAETGGKLGQLTAMGLNWLQPSPINGKTPHEVLHEWFSPEFVRRVMGLRAQHETTVLQQELEQQGLPAPADRDRPRL